MPHEMDQVLHDFLMESQENLHRVDRAFVSLEHDLENRELLADIFRTFHTIKGSAGFLKLPCLEALAHTAEDVLAKVRKGEIRLTGRLITCILHAVDSIRSILLALERTGEEGEHEVRPVIQHLQQIAAGQTPLPNAASRCPAAQCGVTATGFDLPAAPQANDSPPGRGQGWVADTGDGFVVKNPPLPLPGGESVAFGDTREKKPIPVSLPGGEQRGGSLPGGEQRNGFPPSGDLTGENLLTSIADTRIHVDVNILDHLMNITGELVLARNQVVRRANDTRDSGWQTIAQRLHSVVADLQETMLKARMQEIHQVFGLFPRLVHDLSQQHGKEVQLRLEGQKTELDRTLLEGLKEPLIHLIRNAIDHGIEAPSVRRQHGKPAAGTISIRAYHDSGQVHIEVTDDGAGIDPERIKHQALALGLLTPEQAAGASTPALLEFIFRPGFSTAATVTNISGRGVGMDVVKRQLNRLGGVIEIATTPDQGTTFHLRLPMTLAIISGLLVAAQNRQFVIPQQHIAELVRLDEERSHDHVIYELAGAEVYRLRGELLPIVRLTTILNLSSPSTDSPQTTDSPPGRELTDLGFSDSVSPKATNSPPGRGRGGFLTENPSPDSATHPQPLPGGEFMAAPRQIPTSVSLPNGARGAKHENPHIIVLSTGDRRFGLFVENVSDTEEIVVKPLGAHIKQVACYDGATILGDGNVALILNVRGLFAAARFTLDEMQRAAPIATPAAQQQQNGEQAEQRQTIVLFTAGPHEYYGVPLAFVERIETFPAVQIETSGGREILQYRGEVLPLMRLEPLLRLAPPPDAAVLSLIVFAVEKEIGLVVQKVINTVDISTEIDATRFQQKGVLGSTIVQGLAVLILDIHGLIELAYPQWYQQLLVSKLTEAERRQIRVLLVEDSKFFLNIEQSYLTSAGYQVVTAAHGRDALDVLTQQPVDVVVTDIDMPYCNGYELTQAIKTSADWQHIPVMAVTALSGEEDRQRGIAAGIDEYRVKLNRDEVLRALEQLILRTRKRGDVQ